jgi:hypothetical protein
MTKQLRAFGHSDFIRHSGLVILYSTLLPLHHPFTYDNTCANSNGVISNSRANFRRDWRSKKYRIPISRSRSLNPTGRWISAATTGSFSRLIHLRIRRQSVEGFRLSNCAICRFRNSPRKYRQTSVFSPGGKNLARSSKIESCSPIRLRFSANAAGRSSSSSMTIIPKILHLLNFGVS